MWSHNSTACGLCSNSHCMCHTDLVPCLCTNPMTPYWYNNVQLSSTSFLNYQSAPDQSTIYSFSHASNPVNPLFHVENDREAGEQMETKEIDSWLLPDPCNDQIDGSLNVASYGAWAGSQDRGQFDHHMQPQGIHEVSCNEYYGQSSREGLVEQKEHTLEFSQGIQNDYSTSASLFYSLPSIMGISHMAEEPQASLQPTGAGIVPEAAFGTMNLPHKWGLNQFPFLPFQPGNLVQETVGSHSYSTKVSSQGTQQLNSRDDIKRPFQYPPMSRQERILRYFEKKKSRKYEKKVIHSSRKTYARTRPRVRGRFAKSSQIDA